MATKILQIVGNLGNEVYTQNDEPVDAKDGTLWVDLDDEGIVTDIEAALAEAKASGEFKGEKGDQGVSGVYVGSGDMPEGYNVQIDPDGDPTLMPEGGGLTEEQTSALAANTEARHTHNNQWNVLDLLQLDRDQLHLLFAGYGTVAYTSDVPDPIPANDINNYFGAGNPIRSGFIDRSAAMELIDQVNARFATKELVEGLGSPLRIELVEALPEIGEEGVIYLVPSEQAEFNVYKEYLFVNGSFELIGSTQIDLTGYAKTGDIAPAVNSALAEAKASGEFDGVDGKDGIDGQDGADGLSAYQIWLNAGNTGTEADFLASLKGSDGDDGQDGTSVTVASVSESTEDGGSNVVTFSDGKTLTINNGSTGSTGAAGKDGYTPIKGIDYFDGKDGSDYVLTEADKAEIVEDIKGVCVAKNQGSANVGKMLVVGADGNLTLSDIPENVGGDIIGVLDEDNNIIITGKLTNGTYVFKYENTDGTFADIGSLVVGGVVQYSITTTLTECTAASGNAEIINEGETVTLKYVAKDGFALTDTVTVSGASYTWDSTTGTLVLSNPTADVTVAIIATKSGYTNLADPTATGWINNSRIGSSGTPKAEGACQGAVVTNYILIPDRNKTVYIEGLDIINALPDGNVTVHSRYSAMDESTFVNKFYGSAITSLATVTGNITQIVFGNQVLSGEYIRLTGTLLDGYTASDVVITYDEPITE